MKITLIALPLIILLHGCGTSSGQNVGTAAVLGGAAGAIIGNQSGRSYEGAAIGAGVGALSGLAYTQAQQERENQARYRAVREQQIYNKEYDRASRTYRPGPRSY